MHAEIPNKIEFSIIVPVFQASPFLREFYQRITSAAKKLTSEYELIFVNDGSTDETPAVLEDLHHQDGSVVVIHLSRNFGQLAATRTGLAYAMGKYIYVTDCDLEEAPEWLGIFYARMQETGAEIIFGQHRGVSSQPWMVRIGACAMRLILKYFSDIPMVENYVSARLMTRRYLDALLKFTERTGGFYILCKLTGFAQSVVGVEKYYKGSSSYSLGKKATIFIDHIVSATNFPVACIVGISAIIFLGSLAEGAILNLKSAPVTEQQAILLSIWLATGMILGAVGVVGLYVSRILLEVKQRPVAIIRNILGAASRTLKDE